MSLVEERGPVTLYGGIVCVPPFLQLGWLDARGGPQEREVLLDLLRSHVLD